MIQLGDKGPEVQYIQELLVSQGIQCVVDGDFGPNTKRAVKEFQVRENLEADGVVGPVTLAALEGPKHHEPQVVLTIAGVKVFLNSDGSYSWTAGMAIDCDGSPHAYAPPPLQGLDYLRNAGGPGNWYGVVTKNGQPVVQGSSDPAPGFYISPTTYQWPQYSKYDTRKYVNAEKVPFIVVSPLIRNHPAAKVLGCRATVTFRGKTVEALVADTGPRQKIGEASMKCAELLGIPNSPKSGGRETKDVLYKIWPGITAAIDGVIYPLI